MVPVRGAYGKTFPRWAIFSHLYVNHGFPILPATGQMCLFPSPVCLVPYGDLAHIPIPPHAGTDSLPLHGRLFLRYKDLPVNPGTGINKLTSKASNVSFPRLVDSTPSLQGPRNSITANILVAQASKLFSPFAEFERSLFSSPGHTGQDLNRTSEALSSPACSR